MNIEARIDTLMHLTGQADLVGGSWRLTWVVIAPYENIISVFTC